MKGFPTSYKDQAYNDLDAATEQRLGLPSGSVSGLRLFGEKSNADQVSSVGARTPYQFTPTTRKLIVKKYGVDPYLSPENASEAAGLLMKESLQRNNGDLEQAIGEYHGGTNRKAWGPVNRAYRARVMSGINSGAAPAAEAPAQSESDGYDLDSLLAQVDAVGTSQQAEAQTVAPEQQEQGDGYDLDALLAQVSEAESRPAAEGEVSFADIGKAQEVDTRGIVDRAKDAAVNAVTGNDRKVESTEALPDWTQMPELQGANLLGDSTAGGMLSNLNPLNQLADLVVNPRGTLTKAVTHFTDADETAKILKAQNPNMQITQDEKGNYLFTSPTDGKTYAYKPGLRASDIPRIAAQTAAYTVGAPETIAGRAALSAGVQGAIETGEAAAGGDFDAEEVALAGLSVPAIEVPMKAAAPAVRSLASKVLPNKAAKNVGDVVAPVSKELDAGGVATAVDVPVKSMDEIINAVEVPDADFAGLVKKAQANTIGSTAAKEKLADIVAVNQDAANAAKALGLDLPTDILADSRQLAEAAAAGRGIQTSKDSQAWFATMKATNEKMEEALKKLDANDDMSLVSKKVKDSLDVQTKTARAAAGKLYKEVDEAVPRSSVAYVTETKRLIEETLAEVGEANLSSGEKKLLELVRDPDTTIAAMNRQREEIGAALAGKDSAYMQGGRSELGTLKRMYGAMAQDKYNTILQHGGEDAAKKLLAANKLNANAARIEKRIIEGFGKEGEGSVATAIRTALKTGASAGDVKAINKLMRVVPAENKREVLMSGILSMATTKSGHFNTKAFSDLYQGLRKNSEVYKSISQHLSPSEQNILRDMYVISKRLSAAEQLISKTGKANQPLIKALSDGSLIQKLAESQAGQLAAKTAGAASVGMVSPSTIIQAVAKTPEDRLLAVTQFLSSDEFANLARKPAGSNAEKTAINKVAASKKFATLAKQMNARDFSERQKLLSGILQTIAAEQRESE